MISNPFLCKALVHPTENNHPKFVVLLGYQAAACLPSFGPFRLTWSRVKVLQLQVEIPRSCWSSGRSGKAEFCRLWVGVCLFQLDFFVTFFLGGFGKKNTSDL